MNISTLLKVGILFSFAARLMMNDANATNKHPYKKFENPATKFEGTWRVIGYDFRRFEEIPTDFEEQLKKEAAGFSVGQRIHFVHIGSSIMPGSINPITMESSGPIGETLEMTLLSPYSEAFCKGYWSYVCEDKRENFQFNVMIETYDWKKYVSGLSKGYIELWTDISPIQYNLQSLSKSHSFEVWFTFSGEMMMVVTIDGKVKTQANGSRSIGARVGVRLQHVSD